jgi:hypothetical protein
MTETRGVADGENIFTTLTTKPTTYSRSFRPGRCCPATPRRISFVSRGRRVEEEMQMREVVLDPIRR